MKAGFTGGLVIDFPNSTKAKKYVWFLFNMYCVQCESKKSSPPKTFCNIFT